MATAGLLEARRPVTSRDDPARPSARRSRVAAVLGVVALVAAAFSAIGPAERIRTTYAWPPPDLPAGAPSRTWYAPLLLTAQRPSSIGADVPCATGAPLQPPVEPTTVLSTARFPERGHGFSVSQARGVLTFRVGGDILARLRATQPSGGASRCSYRVRLEDGAWSISGGTDELDLGGQLEDMPVVTGLFSELDLRHGPRPSISVTTEVHATKATVHQTIGWLVAAAAGLTALLLVAFDRESRSPRRKLRMLAKHAAGGAGVVDAVVGSALIAWWVLSPVYFDDGWVIARQRGFTTSHGFSSYYDGIGTNLPNGYWLEWLQHWITQSFDTLLVLRVPTLVCIAAMWVLCRWILARILSDSGGSRGLPGWALAGGFLAGVVAWGMTLRPEPATALLATTVLACAVQFRATRTAAPLAVAAVAVPLAVTGHHSGVVALAPLIVVAPGVFEWGRRHIAAGVALLTVAGALVVVLAFVGSDVSQRVADARATRAFGSSDYSWRDEVARYAFLSDAAGTPIRRGWVAIALLAALAYVLRRRHARSSLDLPGASLGVGFAMLIATPSKWPWHFGALIGLAAVAICAESVRLRRDAKMAFGWSVRPFLVIGASLLALLWALSVRRPWGPLDLRTLDWERSTQTPLSLPMAGFGLVVALFTAAIVVGRRRRQPLSNAPWEVASWAALIVTLPLIAFTGGVLAVDAAKTTSWSLTRQNLETLRGDPGCGLADQLNVPATASMRPLPSLDEGRQVPAWLPSAPIPGLDRFALGPRPGGDTGSPWFRLPPDRHPGIFVSTMGQYNSLAVEWGSVRPGSMRVARLGRDEFDVDVVPAAASAFVPWQFVTGAQLPGPPTPATVFRAVLRNRASFGSITGVTGPVTYSTQRVSGLIDGRTSVSLVHPAVRTYFPCVSQPRIEGGLVEAPDWIIASKDQGNPLEIGRLSPFAGTVDLYRLERLPLDDSEHAPPGLIVFRVDRHIPGALEAAPVETTTAS
jgi:cell wall arabinan synthesis protein